MPVVRIYLPVNGADLDELASSGALGGSGSGSGSGSGAPRQAFAVTDALARRAPGADVEDLEFAAFADAAAAADSVRGTAGARRVVAALDADPGWVSPGDGGPVSLVSLTTSVPISRVASFHVDEAEGLGAGDVGEGAGDMLWYDVTELDEVRSLLG